MSAFGGTWGNSYGSKLVLAAQGELLLGTYHSTTGSTGQYHVIGYGGTLAASASQGVGLALCILWRSFSGGPIRSGLAMGGGLWRPGDFAKETAGHPSITALVDGPHFRLMKPACFFMLAARFTVDRFCAAIWETLSPKSASS